jgi:cysteine desulfurase family protein (TIGR01976 family)
MSYDVEAVRRRFPALAEGTAFFDGPGGSQTPDAVGDAIRATLGASLSNRGRTTAAERHADDTVSAARAALSDLLGVPPRGVVFGRSMTQLTYDFARTLSKTWAVGDEIVVTRLDHDADIRPWVQAAERAGVTVRWAEFDVSTGELTPDHIAACLGGRTRLVAVTGASNLIGTMPPLPDIARLVHDAGALLYVDGVHLTAHAPVDVPAFGADFYACSPYKFLGPHCGVVAADPGTLEALDPDKLLPATDEVPERFELGTLPYELLAGTTAAVDFLADLAPASAGASRRQRLLAAMELIGRHEDRLRRLVEDGVAGLPGVTLWSRAARRTPTLLLTFAGGPDRADDAYRFLAARGVNAPAGSFYALEASRHLGLGDTGGLRIGLAPYTSEADVDRLLAGLAEFTAR